MWFVYLTDKILDPGYGCEFYQKMFQATSLKFFNSYPGVKVLLAIYRTLTQKIDLISPPMYNSKTK